MSTVIDASYAAKWFFADEGPDETDAFLDGIELDPPLIPRLFWYELRSLMFIGERRGRLEAGGAHVAILRARRLRLIEAEDASDSVIFDLAARSGLSVYDSAYLALAMTTAARLGTFDRALARAATASGVETFGLRS